MKIDENGKRKFLFNRQFIFQKLKPNPAPKNHIGSDWVTGSEIMTTLDNYINYLSFFHIRIKKLQIISSTFFILSLRNIFL